MSNRQLRLLSSNLALCFFYGSVHNNLFLVSPTEISAKKTCYTEEKKKINKKSQCYYKQLINKKRILFVVTFWYPDHDPFRYIRLNVS